MITQGRDNHDLIVDNLLVKKLVEQIVLSTVKVKIDTHPREDYS